jgi:hypothetical protein
VIEVVQSEQQGAILLSLFLEPVQVALAVLQREAQGREG